MKLPEQTSQILTRMEPTLHSPHVRLLANMYFIIDLRNYDDVVNITTGVCLVDIMTEY